eukprot:jgi/Ulvmu1/732/UM010_0104.1
MQGDAKAAYVDANFCGAGAAVANDIQEGILLLSDRIIRAVKNAIAYCASVTHGSTRKAPQGSTHSGPVCDKDNDPSPEQGSLHVQVALHVLHGLATFLGDKVKDRAQSHLQTAELIQNLRYIQSSAHDIVTSHAPSGSQPTPGQAIQAGHTPAPISAQKAAASLIAPANASLACPKSGSPAWQERQTLTALPVSLAHFAEFGSDSAGPLTTSSPPTWSNWTHVATTSARPISDQRIQGDHAAAGLRGASWLAPQPKSAAAHILFQPPSPPAHAFPVRTTRHRRCAPPAGGPPYLDTVTPLSVAATFAAIAPTGSEAHIHPSTLWSLLEGGAAANAGLAGGADRGAGARHQPAAMTPPLAAFAPPKPVAKAYWGATAQRPGLRSQSPPRSCSPDDGPVRRFRRSEGGAAAVAHAGWSGDTDAVLRPQRGSDEAVGRHMHAAAAAAVAGGGVGGVGEHRPATWAPHLQPQVDATVPACWALSNRVTVANPQKGFRNRPPRPQSAHARVQSAGADRERNTAAMASPLGRATVAITEAVAPAHASHAVPARGISLARLDHPRQRSAPLSRSQRLQVENRELAQLYLGTLSQLRDSMR